MKPKSLIEDLSEYLLEMFEKTPLIDPYGIYQHLMDYWEATIRGDVYQIVADGWEEVAKLTLIVEERSNRSKEKANLVVRRKKYKAELIPPEMMIARYFATEQAKKECLARSSMPKNRVGHTKQLFG